MKKVIGALVIFGGVIFPCLGADELFELEVERGGVVSMKQKGGEHGTDYVVDGGRFGDWVLEVRVAGEDWTRISTAELVAEDALAHFEEQEGGRFQAGVKSVIAGGVLAVDWSVDFEDGVLLWRVVIENTGDEQIEVGDLGFALPTNSTNHRDYTQRVLKHAHVAGDGSFLFWTPWTGEPPFLLMLPEAGTSLEYFHGHRVGEDGPRLYHAYIHSLRQKELIEAEDGSWRWPHSSLKLEPGEKVDRGFRLLWAEGYDDVRDQVAGHGLIDLEVTPGMTVPTDLDVRIALRSAVDVDGIDAEFPEDTDIEHLSSEGDRHVYRVRMRRLGENTLTVRFGEGRKMWLEFFATEPIETLINKRGRFLVERQQIRDESVWYDGLLSDWNMKDEVLLTPDEPHDIPADRQYMIASDDPALGRPAFLAAKNAEHPDQGEIAALDYYIEKFVWGGLQMKPGEVYPYAIYGITNWYLNRNSEDPGPYRRARVFRAYDYPHIILMYHSLYRIARDYPSIETQLAAEDYLRRAYETSIAFFVYPVEVYEGHPAYDHKTGYFNEVVINALLEDMAAEGWEDEVYRLQRYWEKKVNYFIAGEPMLFQSEYPFDTTGFESTHALGLYALKHVDRPADRLKALAVTPEQIDDFMRRQIAMNIGVRGWLEPHYYTYGSDYRRSNARYTLSYMAQMGGWAVLDHALRLAKDPHEHLKLGYGSILSSWALMNTGTEASDYGYWFPGEINDGGAGGGFEPEAYGRNWLTNPHGRGSWYYGCEIDLGFCGYLRAAATVLSDDPVFGMIAMGGVLEQEGGVWRVEPRDGVRRRFHVIRPEAGQRLHVELVRDRFAVGSWIEVEDGLGYLVFEVERADGGREVGEVRIDGMPAGSYVLRVDGHEAEGFDVVAGEPLILTLPLSGEVNGVRIERQ